MPRKTARAARRRAQAVAASMRPRPDATENEIDAAESIAQRALQ